MISKPTVIFECVLKQKCIYNPVIISPKQFHHKCLTWSLKYIPVQKGLRTFQGKHGSFIGFKRVAIFQRVILQ